MDYKQHKGNLRGQIKNKVERKLYNKRIRAEVINDDASDSNCTIHGVSKSVCLLTDTTCGYRMWNGLCNCEDDKCKQKQTVC